MAITKEDDRLPQTYSQGFNTAWDYKSSYVSGLKDGEGLERFAQFSATPDSTVLYAGPARFTGLSGNASILRPIGMADQISIQSNPSVARLYEIGSNRPFFSRGKTYSAMSMGRMLCDQKSLMAVLMENAYQPTALENQSSQPASTTQPDVMMNIDSEYFGVPFGLMVLMKTRGGGDQGQGKIISAFYVESAVLAGYSFQIASAMPVITESVNIEFDRIVPIALA